MSKKKPQNPPEKQPEPPRPKIKLVYVGPCLTSDKKPGAVFYPLTDEQLGEGRLPDTLPEHCVYGGKVPKGLGRPGTVYEYECRADKEGSIFTDTRSFVGFLDKEPRVTEWQANHDTFFAAKKLEQEEKVGKNKNLIYARLASLKVAYSNMVGHQRAIFLAQIIGYVTGRVTKEDLRRADQIEDDDG